MDGKPTVMVLGVFHFRYMQDALEPHRQDEILDVVERLKSFNPTKIGVEIIVDEQETLNNEYRQYVSGNLELEGNEVHQLAFRLARDLGHQQIHATDWRFLTDSDRDFVEKRMEEAESNQPALVQEMNEWIERLKSIGWRPNVREMLLVQNDAELNKMDHQTYIKYVARLGEFPDYVGTLWLQQWYRRNLTVYSNITRLATGTSDRILIVYGSSHNYLLKQFIRESELLLLEDVCSYLR